VSEIRITDEEREDLLAMRGTIHALRMIFTEDVENPSIEALRMTIAVLRNGADALERIADRSEE
jgi:hypothetical protein